MRGWLCLALAAPGMLSASAQDAVMRQGTSIIFSTPDSDNVTSNLTTLSQKTSGSFLAASDALPISNGRTHYDNGNAGVMAPMAVAFTAMPLISRPEAKAFDSSGSSL